MKKILITGGAGFFGSHLAIKAIELGYETIVVDILNSETTDSTEKEQNLKILKKKSQELKNFKFYKSDIRNSEEISEVIIKEDPNFLIHCASLVMDRLSMLIPHDFIETNVHGSQNVIDSLKDSNSLEHIVFVSSRSAIGEKSSADAFIRETDLFRPINPYGATKAAAESLFYCNFFNTNTPLSITRMQPMYGPRCRHDMFVWRVLNSIITGEKIEKYGDGEAVRDWLYIDDAVEAIFKILLSPRDFRTFNIGTGVKTSTNQIIEICEEISDSKANIESVSAVLGDAYFAGISDCSLLEKELNWKFRTDIRTGIEITYQFMKNKNI